MAKLFRGAIMGPPASGKGTISSRIIKKFDIVHFSMGDMLRLKSSDGTAEGDLIQKSMSSGKLLSDDLVMKIVLSRLKEVENKNWLFDGFPRTLVQAEELLKAYALDLVINLNVSSEVIIDRIKSRWIHIPSGRVYNTYFNPPKVPGKDDLTGEPLVQRPDDKLEAVQERLNIYTKTTWPLVDYYRKEGILREFSGRTSDEMWPHIEKTILEFMEYKKS